MDFNKPPINNPAVIVAPPIPTYMITKVVGGVSPINLSPVIPAIPVSQEEGE